MPAVYSIGQYDVAGYCTGLVENGQELPKFSQYEEGDLLIALPANGFHCTGFTALLERLTKYQITNSEFGDGLSLNKYLAQPSHIYVPEVLKFLRNHTVKAVANIGKSLLSDIQRILPENFEITLDFGDLKVPPVYAWLNKTLKFSAEELLQIFNCNIGMVLVVPQKNRKWRSELKGAKVLGVLKHRLNEDSQPQVSQIVVKNFNEAFDKNSTEGVDQINVKLQQTQITATNLTLLERNEMFLNEAQRRLTRVPLNKYKDPILVLGTDGVGTKIKIAQETGRNESVGIDLVAMCVNDILCNGAEPFTFSTYYACHKLLNKNITAIQTGVVEGVSQADSSLIETYNSEVPQLYENDNYDLAGFSLGIAEYSKILPKTEAIRSGDVLIGLPSSGVHSNGFSLVHAVMKHAGKKFSDMADFNKKSTFGEEFLKPTRIYVKALANLVQTGHVKALAHITGGGLTENIPRVLNQELAVQIDAKKFIIPPVFAWLAAKGNVKAEEMLRTYNCGLGMVLVVDAKLEMDVLRQLQFTAKAQTIGRVTARQNAQEPQVVVNNFECQLNLAKQMLVKARKRVAVFISGSGTNLQALIDASRDSAQGLNSDIVLVISNKTDVMGLERAKKAGITSVVVSHKDFKERELFDAELHKHLLAHHVDIVCLAGFMRVLTPSFVKLWKGRLINIHPALLPKHPGLNVQKKALDAGDKESGCTVHFVDEGVDTGAIILQTHVPILTGDTVASLSERIHVAEHYTFPLALKIVATESEN